MNEERNRKRGAWREMSGTTAALTSLVIFGAAAVITTPLVFWYRAKRKRIDALASQPHPDEVAPAPAPDADTPGEPPASSSASSIPE